MNLKRKIYETHSLARIKRRYEFLLGEQQRLVTALDAVSSRNEAVQRLRAEEGNTKRVEVESKVIVRDATELSRRVRLVLNELQDLDAELAKRG